jgi:hypothetical protein
MPWSPARRVRFNLIAVSAASTGPDHIPQDRAFWCLPSDPDCRPWSGKALGGFRGFDLTQRLEPAFDDG